MPINGLSWSELKEYCRQALKGSSARHIVTVNGEILLKAAADPAYTDILKSADLIIPDSTNIALVALLKGRPIKKVTPGSDLVVELARIAVQEQKSLFLLGAQEGIAAKAANNLETRFPGLIIAGASPADPDNMEAVRQIARTNADIVLVGYGAPKQEKWIAAHKRILGAKILVGVGGTFDMLAGTLPRAPKIVRVLHLEWFWRLLLEPSRTARIYNSLIVFPFKALFTR